MPFETGESAVAVLVPAAEPLVSSHRARLDSSAAFGIPAHVTVLYPFLPEPLLTPAVRAELRELFASVPQKEVAFERVGRLGGVLHLAPEPAGFFEELTRRFVRRWPELPPYGGATRRWSPTSLSPTAGARCSAWSPSSWGRPCPFARRSQKRSSTSSTAPAGR